MNSLIGKAKRFAMAALSALSIVAALIAPTSALADGGRTLFIKSAVEHADNTVTLPLYRGTSHGQTVWYILLDSSDGNTAQTYGINRSQKLANAKGSGAVQKVTVVNGVIDFPATVDFSPVRNVVPSATGFPPLAADPGAIGEAGYSPLIQLPNGVILNAPQIANDSGKADKAVSLDTMHGNAILQETDGFSGGKAVKYVSTDASDPAVAALENSTYAPALALAPFAGGDGTDSARASLAAFVNGQTGANNPQRQGLNSALLDGLSPLNVLAWNPSQGRYSPLWDVFPAAWSAQAIAAGQNLRQKDFGDVHNLAEHGMITGPGGAAFGAANFVVVCPIVSSN